MSEVRGSVSAFKSRSRFWVIQQLPSASLSTQYIFSSRESGSWIGSVRALQAVESKFCMVGVGGILVVAVKIRELV